MTDDFDRRTDVTEVAGDRDPDNGDVGINDPGSGGDDDATTPEHQPTSSARLNDVAYIVQNDDITMTTSGTTVRTTQRRTSTRSLEIRARLLAVHLVQGEDSVVRRGIKTLCDNFDFVRTMTQGSVSL